MLLFLVVGGVGLTFLLVSLVFGEALEGVVGGVELDIDLDGGALLSGPVLGAFVAAFGLGGAAASSAGAPLALAAVCGLLNGALIGWIAYRLVRAFMHMPTDDPVRTEDLLGKIGRVVTAIPNGGLGEVLVRHGGQPLKLHGRADHAVAAGTTVVITEVVSTSSVHVSPEDELFGNPKEIQ